MRGLSPLVLAAVLASAFAGCAGPSPEEAKPPVRTGDAGPLMAEIENVTAGLDSSSPSDALAVARMKLDDLALRVDRDEAAGALAAEDAARARAAIADARDRLFWMTLAAEARADPVGSFRVAENKTAQGEARLANTTSYADAGKARADLLHAQGLLVAIDVYHPDAVARDRFDALMTRVQAGLVRAEGWTPG